MILEASHWLASGVLMAYAGLCWYCLAPTWHQSAPDRARHTDATSTVPPVLVAYGSQGGEAARLASTFVQPTEQSALPLNRLNVEQLEKTHKAIFVVSTYGDGEAPDNAQGFARRLSTLNSDSLATLEFSVLALGDSQYPDFCAFGHWLQAQLIRAGGRALSPVLCVDSMKPQSLIAHQNHLLELGLLQHHVLPSTESSADTIWTLTGRELLNEGSSGLPLWRIQLCPSRPQQWQAGDILSVVPPGEAERPRDYSIASLPKEGVLELLVREHRRKDGQPGLASSMLCRQQALGTCLRGHVRSQPAFHPPADKQPLILVGNGSGMAALRALLYARELQGANENLLFFGERHERHDLPYRADIERWLRSGHLKGFHFAGSRETPSRYVQDVMALEAVEIQRWINNGAVVMVCGSLPMGKGVSALLERLLGANTVAVLSDTGRLRREVY